MRRIFLLDEGLLASQEERCSVEYLKSVMVNCICIQGSPVEIKSPKRSNLIGRRMIAPSFVLSPSSILPPPSSYFAFIPARKHLASVSKVLSFKFFNRFKHF
jgi:hypothetical protein